MNTQRDIIIVGAGVAGLVAAAELTRAGRRVLLLEARRRLGGRIFTRPVPGLPAPIELGAEFVHGRPREIFDLRDRFALDEIRGETWCFEDEHLSPCARGGIEPESVFGDIDTAGRDRSFHDYLQELDLPNEQRSWAAAFVEGFHAADPRRVSLHSLARGVKADEEIEGERQYRPRHGYDQLLQLLGHEVNPELCETCTSTTVREVSWRRGAVSVAAESSSGRSEFSARRALITLPLGVLQAPPTDTAHVRFLPELKMKHQALSLLAMGPVIRLSVVFREPFWTQQAPRMNFLFSHERFFPTWWAPGASHGPVLTGWSAGAKGRELSGRAPGEVADVGLRTLAKLFAVSPKTLADLVVSTHTHDWQSDPFSRGGYSYALVGGADAFGELAAPVEETLFFAGEATHNGGHNATVHGAIASGRRAAQQIVNAEG